MRWVWLEPSILGHLVSTLTVEHAQTLDTVTAAPLDDITRGEGLADSFDVGIG